MAKEQEKLEELDAASDGKSTAELLESGSSPRSFVVQSQAQPAQHDCLPRRDRAAGGGDARQLQGAAVDEGCRRLRSVLPRRVRRRPDRRRVGGDPSAQLPLGLVPLPTDEMRYHLLAILAVTLLGSLLWDRLCVASRAARLRSQIRLLSIRVSDLGRRLAQEARPGRTGGRVALLHRGQPHHRRGRVLVYKSYKKREAEYLARQGQEQGQEATGLHSLGPTPAADPQVCGRPRLCTDGRRRRPSAVRWCADVGSLGDLRRASLAGDEAR